MLTSECDRCGKPGLQLHAVVQICNACRQPLRLAPEMEGRLARARDVLARVDVRKRQLTARQQSAVSGSEGWLTLVVVMFVFVCLPFAGCSGFSIFSSRVHPDDRLIIATLFSTPLVVMFGVGAMVLAVFRGAQKRLLLACAALPPAAPGESASCHVCGGPLRTTTIVARCTYCGADNVTTPDWRSAKRRKVRRRAIWKHAFSAKQARLARPRAASCSRSLEDGRIEIDELCLDE